jgi:hypothetical protein
LSQTGTPKKINPKSVAHFSEPETWLLNHHVYHAFHHKLTTKTPRFVTDLAKTPSKNALNHNQKKSVR